jgi:hypothetical protein
VLTIPDDGRSPQAPRPPAEFTAAVRFVGEGGATLPASLNSDVEALDSYASIANSVEARTPGHAVALSSFWLQAPLMGKRQAAEHGPSRFFTAALHKRTQ